MRTLGTIVLVLMLLLGGSFALYKVNYPTYTYRFRLAIAVDVGGETKTAASVIEVEAVMRPMPIIFSLVNLYVHGDAVFLDLGNGRNVVALLACNPDGTQGCIEDLVPNEFGITELKNLAKLETLRGSRELTGRFIPTLVTFRDLNDPKSASVVPPDQFEQTFGPDVHFKRAWIEMTSDPVTRGIEKKLPWWSGPGRPAEEAYRAWLKGKTEGPSIGPEILFKRG
jgi:hypothetical protein